MCDRCNEEVGDEDIGKCPICETDGLCPDCLMDHGCDPNEITQAWELADA